MIIYIDPATAYHEGGHAAMFWHYGIPLGHVSIEPDLTHGYGGVTVPLPRPDISPKFPPNRWANVFAQLVGPFITEITCLRSHGLKVFHLVSAHVGSPPGGTTD